MDYTEISYEEELSNCCGARIYSDIEICSECKEHCDIAIEEDVYQEPDFEMTPKVLVTTIVTKALRTTWDSNISIYDVIDEGTKYMERYYEYKNKDIPWKLPDDIDNIH
jgi:hypothetical protein